MMSSKASRPHSASSTDFQGVSIADGAAVAKIIYDKNFAPILTGALADIDLNFPDAKRPIRSLTRSLNKISRLTMEIPDEPKTNDSLEDDYDQHLIEVNSEFEEEDDETIPDIFRNSALGMFEAGEAIYEFDDDIEVEEQSDSEMAGASEEDELSFDDDAQSDVNGTESEAFDDIMYQDADVAQTSSDDDLSNSEDEDEDEDDNDDSEDEEVERLIIETEIPHDHEMEDADLSGSENSDWESYEEGEENESQIEAVETILQQQDEGGLEIRQILSRQSLDDIDDDDDLEDDIDHGRRRMPTANDAETLPDEFLTEYEYDDDDDDDDDDNDNDDHHGLGRGIAAAVAASEEVAETESVEMQDDNTGNISQHDQAPADLFMNINGREVNVGSLGIDPDFLEALPEDMREEVITQQLRELQDSANRGNSHDEELVTTFLEVLPENVRRELTQTGSRISGGQNIITHELDPASFFATLEPALRETLLLEQDDETLSNLPPHLVAEAQTIRNRTYGRRAHSPPIDELERQLVRSNPKLMNGSFSILFKNPKSLEFDNKRRYFNRQIYQNSHNTVIQLNVRREQVFLDSFKSLYYKSASEIKDARMNIKFQGEEGVDVGGVTREWYQVLSRQIFNPDYALFTPVASDRTTFHPNRTSEVNPEHLLFFKFIGRIIGKAIYDNKLLDCHFSRAVYKQILGKSVSVKDMETLDLDYYKSLVWMLENDITDIITETFSIDADDYGEQKVIDLKPNGRNIPVTEENKAEYVKLVVEYRLVESIKDQLNAFLEGFHDIISKDAVAIFDEQELELLISGMPDIDLDDWMSNTEYRNYTAASPQIKWFWRAVKSFDAEEKAKLLQFATGTSKVPLNGFKELLGMHGVSKFSIHRDYGSKDRLPSSHTCFNQIDLPEYSSYEALRNALLKAITEGREGFGFA
ncbi:hypothetical protein D0Z03_001101 [Geotrichum reessii]|nr:hypothetical protein D0Z03_001101 [Galactomyces reessii]